MAKSKVYRIKHGMIYHSALANALVDCEMVEGFYIDKSHAFRHDLCREPFPAWAYEECDVVYTDPAWSKGISEFNTRAGGVEHTFDAYVKAMVNAIETVKCPVVMTCGKQDSRKYPSPDQRLVIDFNGWESYLLVFRAALPGTLKDVAGVWEYLAGVYNKVGDFNCGYGNVGRVFFSAGKQFVMSDYNKKCIGYIAKAAAGWRS